MLRCNGIQVRALGRCPYAMIETSTLYRPGLTAIAAVLALSSTSAMAQVALPDVAAPAPAPVAAPAAPAIESAPVQTVQSVPATPRLPDIAVADAPAEAAPVARSQPAPRQRTATTAQRVQRDPAQREAVRSEAARSENAAAQGNVAPAVAASAATAVPAAASPSPAVTPVPTAPTTASTDETAPAQQSRAEASASEDLGYAGWALLGGGLLIVAGGAAFAMTRRPRRRDEAVTYEVPVTATPLAPGAFAPAPAARAPEPVAETGAVLATQQTASRPSVAEPAQPVHARAYDDRHAQLEAMVAEAPSEANPFHSRRNRLRRADYLLRTGRIQDRVEPVQIAQDGTAAASSDRWTETRLGSRQNARVSWKPATTR